MEITILESALILAPLTALALVILGYRGKLHFGITLCAGIVSIMIAFAAVALVYLHLFNLSLLWALPLAVLMDFALLGVAFGYSWKLLLKTLLAFAMAAAAVLVTLFILYAGLLACSSIF
ncbi:MAG: hypothetical protein II724_06580 [Clostridia bacterium]|nr:hypothetical protein [Clostridia bacterium]